MSLLSDAAKSLVHSFVVTRLDCCNSIYDNLPRAQLNSIQSVLNGATRLIFGAYDFSHVTPLLRDRLRLRRCLERKRYKLCVAVFKALHEMALGYIADSVYRISSAKGDLRYNLR